jgi:outer membrane lipoprotein-sorting protein
MAGLLAAGPLALAAPQNVAPPPVRTHFSAQDTADLKRASAYLNTLKSVQGSFLQVAANGRTDKGTFYIKKPGRVRFEYQKPNPNLIIADGSTVAVENSDLKTTDRYPLGTSPLRLLLSDNADLSTDPRIVAVKREQGALSVTARETGGANQGSITLTFADSGNALELRQWEVVDAQGGHTMVSVNEMRQVADIPAKLFVIQDLSPFQRGRP